MEHGPISIETAYRMVTALTGTAAEAWIRVAANDPTLIKLALDTGAQNIVVPMVNTKEEAEAAVAAAKYPPQGIRGYLTALQEHHACVRKNPKNWMPWNYTKTLPESND
jgi:2-keto-3-deoxy-L-rhamnonate aldolase RhmA